MHRWLTWAIGSAAAVAACTATEIDTSTYRRALPAEDGGAASAAMPVVAPVVPTNATETLKDPVGAHAELCANDGEHPHFPDDADAVTRTFCQDLKPGGAAPTPHGLADLQKQLGLDFKDPHGGNGTGGNPAFAILGHSSALTARRVSSITPTAFVFTPPPTDGTKPTAYTVLAFDPGETFVEIASLDPTTGTPNFYVVFFDKACSTSAAGCGNADLLTPSLVTGWSNLRVYEDTTALNDTIFDCHVCHQPDTSKPPILRMQENTAPFTHWFTTATAGGRALLADFHAAHGTTEDYGGIPAALVDASDPAKLAALVAAAGFADQPNAFPSAAIEAEVAAAASGQPASNVPPGKSTTWSAVYDRAASGAFIAAPYHDVKVTDPTKLAQMTSAYKRFLSGATSDLPDIRDVFLDEGLRDMGFAAKENAGGRALLVELCQECHHAGLDPSLSRERFLTDGTGAMDRAEKDLAIARLKLPPTDRLAMPPALFRTLTPAEKQAIEAELQR